MEEDGVIVNGMVRHGIECEKVHHKPRVGYLHSPTDDSPYDVDGVVYCGRCHRAVDVMR